MHEYVICKRNCIMGSSQSNSTSTHQFNIYNTHLNAWKYSYYASVMKCMRFETRLSKNPSQNFNNNSLILKNPKIFQRPQNVVFKSWNAWKMREKKLTKWRKSWKSLKKPWGSRLEWDEIVWERKWESYRERDQKKWGLDRMKEFK